MRLSVPACPCFSLCLRASVVRFGFRFSISRLLNYSITNSVAPRHSSHPIAFIPIWRGFQRLRPQLPCRSPCLRASVVRFGFRFSISRLPDYSITRSALPLPPGFTQFHPRSPNVTQQLCHERERTWVPPDTSIRIPKHLVWDIPT